VARLLDVPAERRPLIIIQGDEGPYEGDPSAWDGFNLKDATRKFPILNAYYLPGLASGLYPTITPVNTFRMVFDLYFGGRLPILPDRNFVFRDTAHLYDLTEVTDEVRELVLPPPTASLSRGAPPAGQPSESPGAGASPTG
jgi:hypothetical protein